MNAPVQPGQDIALAFAQALTGEDNPKLRFASLIDAKGRTEQAGEIEGTIPDLWPRIVEAQRNGRGIFLFPNEIASVEGYANAGDVMKCRVHFADFDKGFPAQWHRQPDLIVKTSIKDGIQRGQAYWRVVPADDIIWRRNQRRLLAFYGDDVSVSDPVRRLRLPGTLHLKDPNNPQPVTFEDNTDPDLSLLLPTSDDVVAGLPDLKVRASGTTATDDWSWSQHKPESVRKMLAYVDPVLRDDYNTWVGRIKLLAEQGITLTEPVPNEWWLDTAMEYCRGDLRRRFLDKNFSTPSTFKDSTESEVRAMFDGTDQDNGVGKYTVHSLYLDARDAGYFGSFSETPASELFKDVKLPTLHTVIPLPARHYQRDARSPAERWRSTDEQSEDFDWHKRRTATQEPFTNEEVTELLTTRRHNRKRDPSAASRVELIAGGMKRGYTPQEVFDLMLRQGDLWHMRDIMTANDPQEKLREEVQRICTRLSDDFDRTVLRIVPGQEAQTVDRIERIMIERDTPIFQNVEMTVRPGEFIGKDSDGNETASVQLLPLTVASFKNMVSRDIEFQRFDKRENAWLPTDCPEGLAKNFIDRRGQHILRPVTGITLIPVLRPDGSILNDPGYDVTTGLIFDPGNVTFPDVAAVPSKDDANAALQFLMRPLRDFPFEAGADRSVALSGMLSLLARRIVGYVPMHAFTAPVRGSGKTKLVQISSVLATGSRAGPLKVTASEEENTKQLDAALIRGGPIIFFENCTRPVGWDRLCAAVTAERVEVRPLGVSRIVQVMNNAVVFCDGNNLEIASDMPRRTLLATIDPKVEHPELRPFDFDPIDMVARERPAFIAAALTVLRAYILAGRPAMCDPLGNFEAWSKLVRGALMWLGQDDPCATMAKLHEADTEATTLGNLIYWWHQLIEDRPITVKELIQETTGMVTEAKSGLLDAIKAAIGARPGKSDGIDTVAVGRYLRGNKGRIVDGRRLVEAGSASGGLVRWRLASQ